MQDEGEQASCSVHWIQCLVVLVGQGQWIIVSLCSLALRCLNGSLPIS